MIIQKPLENDLSYDQFSTFSGNIKRNINVEFKQLK